MNASINFHGPYEITARRYLSDSGAPYVAVRFGAGGNVLWLYFDNREQASALIQAATEARELLPEDPS